MIISSVAAVKSVVQAARESSSRSELSLRCYNASLPARYQDDYRGDGTRTLHPYSQGKCALAKCDLAAVDMHSVDDFFFASMLIWS